MKKRKDITQDQAFKMLEKSLKSGKPIKYRVTKVKLSKNATKEEFTYIREALGLKQAQLATILNTSIRTIQGYEQGRRRIPGIVSKLILKMAVSPEFLAEMIGEAQPPIKPNPKTINKKEVNNLVREMGKILSKLKHQIAA